MDLGRPTVKIDATNVLSILQKAEKDKVDALVENCVRFVRGNLQELVNHQGSAVETLSEDLVERIALGTHHRDVELLRDKKDRIKKRLFRHLTERLLDADPHPDLGNPESAVHCFRCQSCNKVLNPSVESHVKCSEGNFTVDPFGGLVPRHTRNENWNAKCHVRSLYFRYKCWRRTYWKVWGETHFLKCTKCGEAFSCNDIGGCKYHPDGAHFPAEAERNASGPIGHFPCCQQIVSRFDPWELNNKGCRKRDHGVNPSNEESRNIVDTLVDHREIICSVDYDGHSDDAKAISVDIQDDESSNGGDTRTSEATINENPSDSRPRPFKEITFEEEEEDEEEEQVDDHESETETSDARESSSLSSVEEESNEDPTSNVTNKERESIWDVTRSRRHNHDVLREHEQKKFREMISSLCHGLEKELPTETNTEQIKRVGIYARLEAQWKESLKGTKNPPPPPPPHSHSHPALNARASVMAVAKFKQIKKSKPATTTTTSKDST